MATEHFGVRLNAIEVFRVTNRLFRPRRDKAGTGLLANLLFQVSRSQDKLKEELSEALKDRATEAMNKVTSLAETIQAFFNSFSVLFGSGRIIEEKVRFQREEMKGERWAQVLAAKEDAITALAAFAHCLEQIAASLDKAGEDIEDGPELQRDIQAQALVIRELMTNIEFVLAAEDENHVYWAEATQRRDLEYEICAAPIDIGAMMAQHFYGKKKSVIFSSATLTVGGRFDFVAGRLGANQIDKQRFRALSVGSSFDFNRQALLCIPNFLPDPGDGEGKFEEDLTDLLKDMLVASQGRALVLFTSYSMLNQVYPDVKEYLENEGILVLGQGKDGTRTALLETFKRDVSSVLLGTQSFWEGIDVVGEALSCLVIAKLPFAVFTDPIIKARCERLEAQGTDSFYGYSVPTAVIKLRQGFGRLIRTKADRGVVVVTDKRVLTRRYGSQFLRSLPAKHRVFLSKEGLVKAVASFLAPSSSPSSSSSTNSSPPSPPSPTKGEGERHGHPSTRDGRATGE
ncbi:MAG: hypothetical protein FJ279_09070 [Planctomycetes bacterium]|nr:hypothetical protein [Planctomycetota bacterium]